MYCEFYKNLNISEQAYDDVCRLEDELRNVFSEIEEIECVNQAKVLNAFHECRVAAHYFNPTTGYGYDDVGRDNLDAVFAKTLNAEAAIVSPSLVSGTHAIYAALTGLLRPGELMLSASGRPYDTLTDAIGIDTKRPKPGSLKEMGVEYMQVNMNGDGGLKFDEVAVAAATKRPRVAYLQRSRGYAWRESTMPKSMIEIFDLIKMASPDTVIVVDNCYGEFTQTCEPLDYGADVIAGSLIKNIGGGLAPTGGYIAGKKEYIDRIMNRLTVPGMGREVGSYAGSYRPFYQGLFNAPHIVAQSLKTAALFARVFEHLELPTMPSSTARRSDIVQALRFRSKDELIAFCRCIQSVSPVDSHVVPEPWPMPGYANDVIMAAGTFVQGASIELSADAPIREPYTAYIQGALNYAHGRIAAMRVLTELTEEKSCQI